MPTVSVEMMPVEFPIMNPTGAFVPNDLVELTGDKGTLKGRVCEVKTKTYGVNQERGLAMMISVTDGKLASFSKSGAFSGYTLTKIGGHVTGTVRKPCMVTYRSQLMAARELQGMLDMGLELIRRAATLKKSDHAVRWFGSNALETGEMEKIHRRAAELRGACEGLTRAIFQCGAGETLGAISTTDPLRNGPTSRIQLGRGFTYDRYSWGERVCTIVHELTHWCIDTVDQQLDDGSDCYGLNCIRLAKSASKGTRQKALNNADNWAYYICEYRTPSDRGDWRNFTEEEIARRGPFVSNGYNTVPGLMAFCS